MRHGIELMLKLLALVSGAPLEFVHDARKLFVAVKALLADVDEESVVHAAQGLGLEPSMIRAFLEASSVMLEGLVEKYANCAFLTPNGISDPKNELFRFPSTTTAGRFELEGPGVLLDPVQVKADIYELDMFVGAMTFGFGRREDGRHILLPEDC